MGDNNQENFLNYHGTIQSKTQSKKRASVSVDECLVNSEDEIDFLTQFLQMQKMQKNQTNDPQEQFERYCIILPVYRSTPENLISRWIKSI